MAAAALAAVHGAIDRDLKDQISTSGPDIHLSGPDFLQWMRRGGSSFEKRPPAFHSSSASIL
jgi:hypothetical protein